MASPAKKTVELFYDVISPYTWIAFEVLCRYRAKWNIDLKLKPFFLGGIMAGADNKPPGYVPSKAMYMMEDLKRLANHYQVPLVAPANPAEVMFIKGSLPAMRFLHAIDKDSPQLTEKVSRELWMRVWHRDEDITEPESLAEVGKAVGLDGSTLDSALKSIKDSSVKERLKTYTQEALDYGAFGSPTIVTKDSSGQSQMIFGSDRFNILADLLGEKYEGPLTELAKSKL